MKKLLILLCLAWISLQATASTTVQPFKATYTGYFGGIPVGTATRELHKVSDNFYRLNSHANALGYGISYSDISRFSIRNSQVILSSFDYNTRKFFENTAIKGRSVDGGNLNISIDGNAHDLISPDNQQNILNAALFSIQFQLDLKQQALLPMYYYAVGEKLRDDDFEFAGEELIKSAIGEYQTVKVITKNSGGSRVTMIWVAPELDYQLIKAKLVHRGQTMATLEIKKFEFLDDADKG